MDQKLDLDQIRSSVLKSLNDAAPSLKIAKQNGNNYEYTGTIPAMQGKQKVEGYYFASLQEKPKDVRFYFFPIYTHVAEYELSDPLKKCLKGKSCFHLKNIGQDEVNELQNMIKKGVELYKKDGLI